MSLRLVARKGEEGGRHAYRPSDSQNKILSFYIYRNRRIEEEVGKEEFAYLIGNFKTEDEAFQFIEKNLLFDLYPDAIVIQYKDSSRI